MKKQNKHYEELREQLYPASEKIANTLSIANKRLYELEEDVRKMFPCILHEIYSKLKKIVEAQNHERAGGSHISLEEQLLIEAGLITYEEKSESNTDSFTFNDDESFYFLFKATQKGIEFYKQEEEIEIGSFEYLREQLYPASEKIANAISLTNKRSYELETEIRQMPYSLLKRAFSELKKIVETPNHERAWDLKIPLEEQLLTEAGLITYEKSYGSHCCVYHFKPTQKGIELYNKITGGKNI